MNFILRIAFVPLLAGALARRNKGTMDWMMISGGVILMAAPLSFDVIPLGILVFSFGFFMDCLARRRRAKAELIIESLRSGGEGAQQGPLE